MAYVLPALQVVAGVVLALLTYGVATTAAYLNAFVVFGLVFSVGLFVAVHGLFRGVGRAVAATTADEAASATE